LIYGVGEKDNLPTGIDQGLEDSECSREWIEAAVMSGITPRSLLARNQGRLCSMSKLMQSLINHDDVVVMVSLPILCVKPNLFGSKFSLSVLSTSLVSMISAASIALEIYVRRLIFTKKILGPSLVVRIVSTERSTKALALTRSLVAFCSSQIPPMPLRSAHTDHVLRSNVSLTKRMLKGTYVSVEPFHLFRYLDEQTFRYNNRKPMDDGSPIQLCDAEDCRQAADIYRVDWES
jgi:hypothetical protein